MNVEASSSSQGAQRQVRLHLTTRDNDIALPDNTGPILVPTGELALPRLQAYRENSMLILDCEIRPAQICPFYIGE